MKSTSHYCKTDLLTHFHSGCSLHCIQLSSLSHGQDPHLSYRPPYHAVNFHHRMVLQPRNSFIYYTILHHQNKFFISRLCSTQLQNLLVRRPLEIKQLGKLTYDVCSKAMRVWPQIEFIFEIVHFYHCSFHYHLLTNNL